MFRVLKAAQNSSRSWKRRSTIKMKRREGCEETREEEKMEGKCGFFGKIGKIEVNPDDEHGKGQGTGTGDDGKEKGL